MYQNAFPYEFIVLLKIKHNPKLCHLTFVISVRQKSELVISALNFSIKLIKTSRVKLLAQIGVKVVLNNQKSFSQILKNRFAFYNKKSFEKQLAALSMQLVRRKNVQFFSFSFRSRVFCLNLKYFH